MKTWAYSAEARSQGVNWLHFSCGTGGTFYPLLSDVHTVMYIKFCRCFNDRGCRSEFII